MAIPVPTPVVGSPRERLSLAPLLRPLRSPCGRTVLSCTMAGGVLLGGAGVAALIFAGLVAPDTVRMFSSVFFVIGAAAGLANGVVLAFLGRERSASPGGALLLLAATVAWLVPALAASGVVASWVSLSWAALHLHRIGVVLGVTIGWVAGMGICGWAVAEGLASVRRALARWAAWRAGRVALLAAFASPR